VRATSGSVGAAPPMRVTESLRLPVSDLGRRDAHGDGTAGIPSRLRSTARSMPTARFEVVSLRRSKELESVVERWIGAMNGRDNASAAKSRRWPHQHRRVRPAPVAESSAVIQESAELEAAARRWMKAVLAGDRETPVNLYSDSAATAYIGTDPDEDWSGSDVGRVVAAHAAEVTERIGWEIELDTVDAYGFDEGGWSIVRGEVLVGELDPFPFRSTQVWALESGQWRIVHSHNSIGVTNQAAVGVTLTSGLSELLGSGQDPPDSKSWSRRRSTPC
jgi:hypothetical protein